MMRKAFQITAVFFVCFFVVAVFHEAAPGLCQSSNGTGFCPFCKLIHTFFLASVPLLLFMVRLAERRPQLAAVPIIPAILRFCRLLRGPPAIHA